ncbi:MAG TPA: hypothetical protein VL201_05760 [Patescibacteria group bacterium]|nr:hypothetical protein [Patescibacteria group bacterium]
MLQNTVSDIISMYNAFRIGNEENTYILYANDDTHNTFGNKYKTLREEFRNMVFRNGPKIKGYQPTVAGLESEINSRRYLFSLKYKRR